MHNFWRSKVRPKNRARRRGHRARLDVNFESEHDDSPHPKATGSKQRPASAKKEKRSPRKSPTKAQRDFQDHPANENCCLPEPLANCFSGLLEIICGAKYSPLPQPGLTQEHESLKVLYQRFGFANTQLESVPRNDDPIILHTKSEIMTTRSINQEWRKSRYYQPRHKSDPDIMSDLIRLRARKSVFTSFQTIF